MATDIQEVLKQRGATHGDFKMNALCAQSLKSTVGVQLMGKDISAEHREALDMILHKIARICSGNPNVVDHWQDIAGYATLAMNSIPADKKI